MSASSLPDFDHTLRLSQGSLDAPDLAECHGLLCGMVCRESSRTPRDFLDQLSAMELVVRPGQALNAALADAWRSTVEQLADEDMGFTLWLPDDEEPLEDRTVALAQWCSGFLAGLGSAGPLESLSDAARDAPCYPEEIGRSELAPLEEEGPSSNDEEVASTEIVEYVRIVALMMREDFRGPKSGEVIH